MSRFACRATRIRKIMQKSLKTWAFAITVVLAMQMPVLAGEMPAGGEIIWTTSIPQAVDSASAGHRPVLVDVWAVWCAPCKLMEEKVWPDPGVRERMARFVPLKVDADANEVFTARYDAEVLPATLFLDGKGRLITKLTGYAGVDRLSRIMDAVVSGYDDYMVLKASKADPDQAMQLATYYENCENSFEAASILRKAIKKAKKGASLQLPDLELQLAETLLLTDRPEQGARNLERLAVGGGDPDYRSRAQAALDQYRAGLE